VEKFGGENFLCLRTESENLWQSRSLGRNRALRSGDGLFLFSFFASSPSVYRRRLLASRAGNEFGKK